MKEEMFRLIAKKIKRYAAVTCAAALVVGSFRSDLLVGMGKELLDNFDAGTSFYVGKDSVSGADPAGVDAKRTLIMEAALEKEDGNYVYGESQYLTLKVSEVVDQDTGLDVTQGDVTGNVVDDENVEVEVILNKKENDTWKTLETNEYAVNIQEEYKLPVGENTYNEPGEYQIHINPKNDKTVEANLDFTVAEKELLYTVRAKNKNFDNTTNVELEVVAPEETYGVSVSLTDSAKQKAHFKNAGDVTETKSVEVIAEEGLSVDDYIVEGNEENRYDVILDWEAELKADIIANAVIKEDTLADIVEYSTKYQDENGKYWLSEMDQYNQLIIRVKDGMTGYKLAQNLPEEGQALQNDEISVETVELENGNAVFYVANEKGEISQAEISGLGIDTTAPAISMKDINGEANSFVVSNTEQTYKVEASDEESRIASVKYIVTDVEKDSIDWNGKEVKEASVENAVVSVPAFGYLYVQAIDNVGNAAVNDANSGSHSMVLDEDAPKLVIRVDDRDTDSEAVSVEKKHKLQIVAEDDLSGVASISYTLNDTSYYGEQKNEKYESLEDYKAEWKNVTLEGITLGENEELDGAYTLLVKSEDFAGNEIPKEVELYFDNTAPQYEIKVAGDNFHEKEVYYGNTGFEVELTVTEANEMAADATRLIIKRNGEILNAEQLQVEGISAEGSADQKSWKVTIPETAADGNYTVELSGMDAAGNSIEKIPTESLPKMILDKNAPSYTVEVKNVEPVDGFYYYGNEGFTAILSITETNKLAESLEVIVKRDGTKLDNTALTNENITIVDESEGERKNWKVSIPGTVAEGIYTVELSGTDAAGNGITVIPEDTLPKMILDITAPSYKIDVKNAETVEAPYYYGNAGFDITLSVTENNKMAVNANVVVKKDEVALDSAKLASEQIVITDESEGERKNWKVSIPAAASEGSYTVELKGTDAANNAIVEIQGVSLPKMILDKTAPEVSYSLNDQKIDVGAAKTISFGNTDRIYKVEIVEANGVKEAYYAISYADNAAEINQWKSVDEDWNATVKIGNNGYLFVKATDKAGNTKICDVKQPLVLESNAPEVAITDENDAQIKNVHPITVEAIDMPETGFSGVQYIEYELYEKGNLTKKDAYSGSVVQANAPENLEKLYEGNQYRLLSSILAEYGKVSTDLNGEYLLKVKATDYSGNSSKEQEKHCGMIQQILFTELWM